MFCMSFAFILKTSLIARANLFFCLSDIFKKNPAFLDHWMCDIVFKLTGTVVLLVSVAGVSFLLCLNKEQNKLLIHNHTINQG